MKNFLSFFATAFLMSGVLFLTSCGEDDTVDPTPGDVAPTVAISSVSETIVDGGATVTFTVTAAKGTNDLQSFTVTEDGITMTDRYSIAEYTANGITLNNPQLLTGNDVSNFVYTVNITVPSENSDPMADEDYFYKVIVAGNKGLTAEDEIIVTVNGVMDTGTPTTFEMEGVLMNQAGANGGLDLDNATQTGTGSTTGAGAELRDLGIDCTISSPNENWVASFGTLNGAEMRAVDLTQVEGFTFASATTTEAIQGAYDTGIALSDGISTAPNCDETTVTDVTTPAVGDMYVISANSTVYLIRVDEINAVADDPATTPNENNNDNYVFSIKY